MSAFSRPTAEEERLQHAASTDDAGETFASIIDKKDMRMSGGGHAQGARHAAHGGGVGRTATSAQQQQRQGAHPNTHAPTKHASSVRPHTPSKSPSSGSMSPSASSSPRPETLPYQHPTCVFQSNAPYLAPNASPSQLDGLSQTEEFQLRAHTCVFMSGLGQKMKLGQLVLATASVFVQVVFTHYSFKALDRLEVAITCLFIAMKVEKRGIGIDCVLSAYFGEKAEFDKKMAHAAGEGELYAPRPAPLINSPEWDQLRTRVYEYESIILDALEYNFDVLHPYSFLRKFLEKYIYSPLYAKESEDFIKRHLGVSGGLAQIAWNFINDSLRTSLCIRYSPSVICVVAIRMAMHHLIQQGKLHGEPVKSSQAVLASDAQAPTSVTGLPGGPRVWHEELFGLNKKTVNRISSEILHVLEIINENRNGNLQSLLAVHRKAKMKSTVRLPEARSTQELLASIQNPHQRPQQGQRGPGQAQAHSHAAHPQNRSNHTHPPHASHLPPAGPQKGAAAPSSDRKRPRSPDRDPRDRHHRNQDGRKDDRDRTSRPAYSPLPAPPSPFIDAGQQKSWLPDLRPNRPPPTTQHRDSRDREREHDRSRRRSRSRSRRSRSPRRSRSRDVRPSETTAAATAPETVLPPESAKPEASPMLGAGEVRDTAPTTGAPSSSVAREDAHGRPESFTSSQPVLSPHGRRASMTSSTLTKSCSTLDLPSTQTPHAAHARLSSSASMSCLSAPGVDILSGDILRMSSSCHSPSAAHAAEPNEEDIMRDITREAKSLNQERREEKQQMQPDECDDERAAKRARIDDTSRPPSPGSASRIPPGEFESADPALAPTTPAVATIAANIDEAKSDPFVVTAASAPPSDDAKSAPLTDSTTAVHTLTSPATAH